MKKLIALALTAVFAVSLVGCGNGAGNASSETNIETTKTVSNKNDIDGYKYGDFDTYNSYAEDNGLAGTKIYIKGKVKSVYTYSGLLCFSVQSEDNGRWLTYFVEGGDTDKADNLLDEQEVTCFGEYQGFSDVFQMPTITITSIMYNDEKYKYSDFEESYDDNSSYEPKTTIAPETEPVTEKVSKNKSDGQTIIKSHDVKVVYKGIEETAYGKKVKLYIENNSKYDYVFQLRNVSINGYMCEPTMSVEVNSSKKVNDGFTIETDFLDDNDITGVKTIDLSLHAFNWDDDSHDFDSETVTFKP